MYLDDTAGSVSVQALLLERTSSRQSYGGDGTLYVYDDGSPLALQLVGRGLDTVTRVKFTSAANPAGGPCTSEAGHYQVNRQRRCYSCNSVNRCFMFRARRLCRR